MATKRSSIFTAVRRFCMDDIAMTMIDTEAPPAVPFAIAGGSRAAEALRYALASAAALALDASLLWVGVTRFGLPPWFAGAITYAAGLVVIYLLSVRWVFARRVVPDARSEFVIFAVLGLFGMALNSGTLYAATAAGLALPIAKGISAAIGFAANFVSRRAILFSARAA